MAKSLGPNRYNRGSILPLVAVSAPLLLGGAGYAVDVAGWYRGNQRLQMAADAAALESSRLLTNQRLGPAVGLHRRCRLRGTGGRVPKHGNPEPSYCHRRSQPE